MKQRLQRILSILCVLALIIGCTALTAFAEEESVIKVISVEWDDENDYEGLRRSVNMKIADKTVMLNADNNWSGVAEAPKGATWEIDEPQGYTTPPSVFGNGSSATKVVYHHLVRKDKTVPVHINWVDDDNAAGLRPDSVRINLLADDVICRPPKAVKGTSDSWSGLYLHKKGSATEEIVYTVGAADPVEGYAATVNGNTVTYTLLKGSLSVSAPSDVNGLELVVTGPDPKVKNGMKLTGSYNIGEVIPGAYVVQETNASSLAPEGYMIDSSKTQVGDAVYVNAGESKTLNIKVAYKEAEGEEPNEEPLSETGKLSFEILGPNGFDETVTYDKFKGGKYIFDNLLPGTYAVIERNPEGLVRAYSIKSNSVTGMVIAVGKDSQPAVLENKYEPAATPIPNPEMINIPVVKIWNDESDKDGNRPDAVTIKLYANGVVADTHLLTAAEGWSYTFRDLPDIDKKGEKIEYSVNEDPVEWYAADVSGNMNEYYITNNYTPEVTSATVSKVWDDGNNAQRIRPTSLAVTLLPVGDVYILNAANGWSVLVNGLPTKLNGEEVSYSWTEQEAAGYVRSSVSQDGSTTVFTNRIARIPQVPEDQPQPDVPRGTGWVIFGEYDTALGGNVLINHVGDCFD